jgi:site-specific DNA-methyltransferase (adenine-specific)
MKEATARHKTLRTTGLRKKPVIYNIKENPSEFYVSEESATYGNNVVKPYTVYYRDLANSVTLLKGDCIEILNQARENSVDMIFADPPYFLSNGGITCHAGKMVSVNKGKWDKSKGVKENHDFTLAWLKACQRVLKPNGTIWVSGTTHIIFSVGFAMQELGYKILNDIIWYTHNTRPEHFRKIFPNHTDIFIWAAKSEKSKHYFDYKLMKKMNNDKQMRNFWQSSDQKLIKQGNIKRQNKIPSVPVEKRYKNCILQRPKTLLERIILAATKTDDLIVDSAYTSCMFGNIAVSLKRKYVGIIQENNHDKSHRQV